MRSSLAPGSGLEATPSRCWGGAEGQAGSGVGIRRGKRGPAGWRPAGKTFLHCSPPHDGYMLPPQGDERGQRSPAPPHPAPGNSPLLALGGVWDVEAQLGSVMRSGFRKVLGSQPPMECCPSPGLRGVPKILWWVQGRLNPQPWGGRWAASGPGVCPVTGEPGVPAAAGVCPLRRHLCPGLWFVGLVVGDFVGEAACRGGGAWPRAASMAVALRPHGRIRWLEASSGPERLFRHVGQAGSDTTSVWLFQQEDRDASGSGPRGGHFGVASPQNHSTLPTSGGPQC